MEGISAIMDFNLFDVETQADEISENLDEMESIPETNGAEVADIVKATRRDIQINITGKIAKESLCAFLYSLPIGKSWHPRMLRKSSSAANGLYQWICRKYGGVHEKSVRKILGSRAHALLSRNPFKRLRSQIQSTKKKHSYERQRKWYGKQEIKRIVFHFLRSLPPDSTWNARKLRRFMPGGRRAYDWISYHYASGFGEFSLRDFLGEPASQLLVRNPLVKNKNVDQETIQMRKPRITLLEARCILEDFIRTLAPGESWNIFRLQKYRRPERLYIGLNTYDYIRRHYTGGFCEQSVRGILEEKADQLLTRNPLKLGIQKKAMIKTEEDFKKYFKLFLDSFPEGQSWSPKILIEFRPVDSECPYGQTIWQWIRRCYRNEGAIDWLYILIKCMPEGYLEKHPFRYKKMEGFSRSNNQTPIYANQNNIDLQTENFGRGIYDENSSTPEELIIKKEEEISIQEQKVAIDNLLTGLGDKEQQLLRAFRNGEDVSQELLAPIINNLQSMAKEKFAELFA